MEFLCIIPARYASSRFPGKPLTDIRGKTMIQRVYEKVSDVIPDVYVATDDSRIEETVKKFGGLVVSTSSHHKSGTDRCAEALEKIILLEKKQYDVVINVQGDEPFIHASQILSLMECFSSRDIQIATLAKKITTAEELKNPARPKVVLNNRSEAIYFSRSIIPFYHEGEAHVWQHKHIYYKHLGIYAFRSDVLQEVTSLDPSPLEIAESLEQNRWIENCYSIKVAVTQNDSYPVDTPDDLKKLPEFLFKDEIPEEKKSDFET
jgi:3-deoxy-manno-octulosonate cytidylyltransferase (CMP-KDO synthetase)